jgi:Mg-chelatase subunit ChlD
MATKDRILDELSKGGRTTKQMIAKVGGTYASVHTSLKRMKDRGLVSEVTEVNGVKLAGPTWFLVSQLVAVTNDQTYADAQKQAAAKQTRKRRTKAIVVVDVSGSMNSYRYDLNKYLNAQLTNLREEAFRTGEQIDVSLYYFNDHVTPAYLNVNARDVKSESVKYPDGGTALFDTVSTAIGDHLKPERIDEDVAYLLIVQTDGQDEHSYDRKGERMKELVRQVQSTDRWTITFQLPPGFKQKFCTTYGIHSGNCIEWERSTQGMEVATQWAAAATSNYVANRSVGINAMSTFYTDLSDLTSKDLKTSLANIQDKVKTFTVPAEVEIRPFIEEKTGYPYQAGSVFYQLTKTEKVQDTKKLLIQEKNTKAIYAGNEARTLLGLPTGVDCRVRPGNHANFDLFVQSTSVNRKLVRGTKLVHWPLSLQT